MPFQRLKKNEPDTILLSRKFIATQEMIEYHTSREKKVSFELTI